MRRLVIAVFSVSSVLLTLGSLQAAKPPDGKKFGWHTDYASAKAEAKRAGKPIFLVFRCEP